MKTLQMRPMMIASGAAFVVHTLFSLLGLLPVLLIQGNPAMLENYFSNINPDEFPAGLIAGFAVIGLVLCCVPFLTDMGAGALYVILHNRTTPIELQDGFLGGAAAAALGRVGGQIAGMVINLLAMPILMSRLASAFAVSGAVTSGIPPSAFIVSAISAMVSGVFGIIIGTVMGAVFGGAGGGITAAILERRSENAGGYA